MLTLLVVSSAEKELFLIKHADEEPAFNTLTDFFLTVQPALLIMHTKLATSNKIGVASLLCLSIM